MGNKSAQKVPVNKERFMEILKLRNSSIRKLGEAYEEIERTEKTILGAWMLEKCRLIC